MTESITNLFDAMFTENPIYRVQGYYASGRFVSHLVSARDANRAIEMTLNADNRIIRITSAKPTLLS